MVGNVSGNSKDRMVRFKEIESTKEAKPGVFSQLKTWMKTRLYGSAVGGWLVRYGTRKIMAAVKKHTTAVNLLEYIERDISNNRPVPNTKSLKHDKALAVIGAQLKQARIDLEKAQKALGSKEADFSFLSSSEKNIEMKKRISKSKSHISSMGISRHALKTLSQEMRASIKREWSPGLFTRSAEQRRAMESVRDLILDALIRSHIRLEQRKNTKGEIESMFSKVRKMTQSTV